MHLIRTVFVLAAVAAALAPTASAAGPTASASKTCDPGDERSYGTTYVTTINVSNTSCRGGKRLIRAYHRCRPGRSGKCASVKGYSCSEKRYKGRTQYESSVTCRKGGKTVKHNYTQYT